MPMNIGSFGKVAASIAAFSLVASPAFAAVQSVGSAAHASPATLPGDVAHDRGWGGGWNGGGWGGRRHHGDIDAGDVLAGVFVLGTIAAIASAASKSNKEKRAREEWDRGYDSRNDSWRNDGRGNSGRYGEEPRRDSPSSYGRSGSLDTAVDTCVGEVERGTNRVDTVDAVNREGDGWRVEGRTRAGSPWNCSVDGTGRIKGFSVETAQAH